MIHFVRVFWFLLPSSVSSSYFLICAIWNYLLTSSVFSCSGAKMQHSIELSVADTCLHTGTKSISIALEDVTNMQVQQQVKHSYSGDWFSQADFLARWKERGYLLTELFFSPCYFYEVTCKHTPNVWQVACFLKQVLHFSERWDRRG